MKRLLRSGRRMLRDYCVRPFLRSLVSLGVMYVGLDAFQQQRIGPALAARSSDPYALYALGDLQALEPYEEGPPAAHPEKLCADVPLSEEELRLARDLWPKRYSGRRARGSG
ncbi:hypothetical protein OG730_42985 (plasmid) [Streptomyces sp. NBC_01298]|uniref:DUF6059 family protein n=1 Tax=Streptomyces sp. NBC_01298 TaxID=2903817 RepID=UPI002E10DD3C|nr:hypothetical protein OG730_42985 [Streptomyces sp. NBC_01298]